MEIIAPGRQYCGKLGNDWRRHGKLNLRWKLPDLQEGKNRNSWNRLTLKTIFDILIFRKTTVRCVEEIGQEFLFWDKTLQENNSVLKLEMIDMENYFFDIKLSHLQKGNSGEWISRAAFSFTWRHVAAVWRPKHKFHFLFIKFYGQYHHIW